MTNNNNNKVPNVPNLRFPEFTGEWEETTIGEIGNIKNGPFGSVLHAEDYVQDGMPIVTTEHFKNGSMPITKDGIPQVSNDDYKRLHGFMLQENDIVFSRVGSVDVNSFVTRIQNGWLFSGRVLRVRPETEIDSLCLHYILSTESVKRDIRNRAVGQTMPSINTPILSSTAICIPFSQKEQRKISRFLSLIDERISTQNKIIDRLQSLIKGIAQNIANAGKKECLISNCLEYHTSTLQESSLSENGQYPAYGANGISGYTDNALVHGESILIIKDGSNVGSVCYVKGDYSVIGTLNFLTAKKGFNLRYLYFCLKVFDFTPFKTGMAIPHIYFKDYSKAKIYCPHIDEQNRIAKVLTKLEDKLYIEQNIKLLIINQKKYLLQQMFI